MISIKQQFKSGFLITFISKYSQVLIEIIVSIILSRLLSPREFGIAAIVFVFSAFFNIFGEIGLGPAIIQHKDIDKNDIDILFFFSIILGVGISAIFVLLSPAIAWFYEDNIYINIGYCMTLIIMLNTISVVPESIIRKELGFKYIGIVNISANLIGGMFAIIFANLKFGVYALILKNIITAAIIFSFFLIKARIRFNVKLSFEPLKKVLNFSVNQFAFNVQNYFSRNIDNFLIGKYLGSTQLGYYDRAFKLMRYPVNKITFIITPVLHPILSKYQNNIPVIRRTYYKVVQLLAAVALPLSIVMYSLSEEIIIILYGPNWSGTIPVFKMLSLCSGTQMLISSTGAIYQSIGRTDTLFRVGLANFLFVVTGIIFGMHWGINGVAIGLASGITLSFFPYFIVLTKLIDGNLMDIVRIISKPLLISFILIILVLPIKHYFFIDSVIIRFMFISLSSFIIYLSLIKVVKLDKVFKEFFKK